MSMERRHFLKGMLSIGALEGLFGLSGSIKHLGAIASPLADDKKFLVTVALDGGNDYLNTLIPWNDGIYHDKRPRLTVPVGDAQLVGEGLYLHPNLSNLKSFYDSGNLALIRGVGHAADDRSHFSSMARWMTGTEDLATGTGWLGRFKDGSDLGQFGTVAIGRTGIPRILHGPKSSAIVLPPYGQISLFRSWREDGWEPAWNALRNFEMAQAGNGALQSEVAKSLRLTAETGDLVSPIYETEVGAPSGFVNDLLVAADILNLNVGTQIVHAGLPGFDTHDRQKGTHEFLLRELDIAIGNFFANLLPSVRENTAVLIFSEFGRRVSQNESGTDHGTAGLVMLVGDRVRGGLHGVQPSLRRLDSRGDLRHEVDFRSIYASVISQWLGADPEEILGRDFGQLLLFDSPRAFLW